MLSWVLFKLFQDISDFIIRFYGSNEIGVMVELGLDGSLIND